MLKSKSLFIVCVILILTVAVGSPTVAQDAQPVRIAVSWGGDTLTGFVAVLDASGIPYELVNIDTATALGPLVAGGNPPDIAQMTRPGQIASFARDGALIPLTSGDDPMLPPDLLEANQTPAVRSIGVVDGETYALMVKISSKGTVFYKPASLKALGMETPKTWEEFVALEDAYIANGQTPLAIAAQDGWTLTDWFEALYVNVAGPDMYNKLFVTHEVKWTDPTVVQAMELFRQIFDPADKKLAGGADGALSTKYVDAINETFRSDDPAAEMFYEGSFAIGTIIQNFPDLVCGVDFDFFDFPPANDQFGSTLTGGGDMLVAFNDRPEVRDMMRWLAGTELATLWSNTPVGSILSPNINVPTDTFDTCKAKEAAQITSANAFVFDGSDLAPGAVGGDAMFTALQAYIADPNSLMDILQTLEEAASAAY